MRRGRFDGARTLARGVTLFARLGVAAVGGGVGAGLITAREGRPAARRHAARKLTETAVRLGPTYVKAAQILGTRRDVLPPVLCDEFGMLHDDVVALGPEASRLALRSVYGPDLDEVFAEIDYEAIAAGSVACVYRARLRAGDEVALKLRRPGIEPLMQADLRLIRRGAALMARLPAFRGIPVNEVVASMTESIIGQLDFERESDSLQRLRENLSVLPRVLVPRVVPEASRPTCIVMQYLPDLDRSSADQASAVMRRGYAGSTLSVMYHMLFIDGFVHCDLHPGNLYFLAGGQVVVLDAGFSAQLTERMRKLFAKFFLNMSIGRGTKCAELVIESSLGLRAGADPDGFTVEMAALVERNHGAAAKDFSLVAFATEMFQLQRQFGIAAAPELVFPLLSLLVIEGTVRELDPAADFQATAKPVVTRAVFGA